MLVSLYLSSNVTCTGKSQSYTHVLHQQYHFKTTLQIFPSLCLKWPSTALQSQSETSAVSLFHCHTKTQINFFKSTHVGVRWQVINFVLNKNTISTKKWHILGFSPWLKFQLSTDSLHIKADCQTVAPRYEQVNHDSLLNSYLDLTNHL